MNTNRIKEALLELQRQRDLIDKAIVGLNSVLVSQNGDITEEQVVAAIDRSFAEGAREMSYVDLAATFLEAHGRPMHVKRIWNLIKDTRQDPKIKRQSVESTLLRHIQMKGEKAKIKKVAPATYALVKKAHPVAEPAKKEEVAF